MLNKKIFCLFAVGILLAGCTQKSQTSVVAPNPHATSVAEFPKVTDQSLLSEYLEGYLANNNGSKEYLIDMLEISGFDRSKAEEEIEKHTEIDWTDRACKMAQAMWYNAYLSKDEVRQQMKNLKYTTEEIDEAMKSIQNISRKG